MTELERVNEALRSSFKKEGIYKKADMANYLGYRSGYFSGVINGKEKMSDSFLKKISEKLNISYDWLITGEGEMLKSPKAEELEDLVIDCKYLIDKIAKQAEEIGRLKAENEQLKRADAQTGGNAGCATAM